MLKYIQEGDLDGSGRMPNFQTWRILVSSTGKIRVRVVHACTCTCAPLETGSLNNISYPRVTLAVRLNCIVRLIACKLQISMRFQEYQYGIAWCDEWVLSPTHGSI